MKVLDLQSVRGVRVILRASLNVPVEKGSVTNTFRLERALPTIEALAAHGARVIIVAHLGEAPTDSLKPVWQELMKLTRVSIRFVDAVVGEVVDDAAATLKDGEVMMLENVRRERGETANDSDFARKLAFLGDMYVNDAFADSHRAHASIVGIPGLIPGFAGPSCMAEYRGIEPALAPPSPSLAIVGGAKFMTKEPLLRTLLKKYDRVFVGGAIADDFFAARGWQVGRSLVSHAAVPAELLTNSKLVLPVDVTVEGVAGTEVKSPHEVTATDTIVDIGPASVAALAPAISKARFVLWNGPMGNFEKGFCQQTDQLAQMVLAAPGRSVIGGGDTIAATEKYLTEAHKTNNFVSTAGGAMLQFIADGTLPGIDALEQSH